MSEYTLLHEIKVGSAVVAKAGEVLQVRRPKVSDLEAMEKASGSVMTRSVMLLASLIQMPPEAIREMDGEDFQSLDELVTGMLGKRRSQP
jgi:hypothetical protein